MKINIVEARVYCTYCKIWTQVGEITFGPDFIGAECEQCGVIMDYSIPNPERVKLRDEHLDEIDKEWEE